MGRINIDKTAPTISASRTPAANSDGWNKTDVTVQFSCGDPVHGGTASGVVSCPGDVTVSGEGANQSVTRTVFDKAGNSASATKDNINIDKTAPNLGITDNNAVSYNFCGAARPSQPVFSPSDTLSGLDGSQGETWTTPGTPNGVGTYTYSAHVQDKAGNAAAYGPKNYTLLYGAAVAQVPYLQPINADGSSRFKLGSTIPVKFQALCNGTPVAVVAKMYVKQGDSQPDPGVDEAISTAEKAVRAQPGNVRARQRLVAALSLHGLDDRARARRRSFHACNRRSISATSTTLIPSCCPTNAIASSAPCARPACCKRKPRIFEPSGSATLRDPRG